MDEARADDSDDEGQMTADGDFDYFPSGDCLLSARKLSLAIGDTLVLDSAQLVLQRGHCYGLIGPNGAGKTTLLRWLCEYMVDRDDTARVKYVGQTDAELSEGCQDMLLDYVLAGNEHRAAMLAEVARLEEECSADTAERLAELLVELDADDTEDRAREALATFQFSDPTAAVATLSGGWRSRLEVARALVARPEVLFLDEPTNHLDIEAVLRLGGLLRDARNHTTVIVVSHDAAFLDFVVTDIVCVNKQTVQHVPGDYANFEEMANQYRQFHEHLYEKRADEEERMVKSLQKQKQRARHVGDDKALRNASARTKKLERVGMYREDGKRYKTRSLKLLDAKYVRLPLFAEPVRLNGVLSLRLPDECVAPDGAGAGGGGPPLIQLSGLEVGYGDRVVLAMGDEQVCGGDRIALVGVNGCGKSTLMRAIADGATVVRGSVGRGTTRVGVVDQNQLALLAEHLDRTPAEFLIARHPQVFKTETAVRSFLGRFGLGGAAGITPILYLSGGVRVRVVLADVFVKPPDVLLLDEPTNHLDGETIVALGNALRGFRGAIVGVSHNCSFLLDVFRELWVCAGGRVAVHREAAGSGPKFSDHFGRFAAGLVRPQDSEVFKAMLRTRAARSSIVAQQPRAITSLIV